MDLNFTFFPHPPTPLRGEGGRGVLLCLYKYNFIMDRVQAQRNRTRSLRNTRESARRQENGEQARRQTRNASRRSRRQQESANSLNNGDKLEMTVLDR